MTRRATQAHLSLLLIPILLTACIPRRTLPSPPPSPVPSLTPSLRPPDPILTSAPTSTAPPPPAPPTPTDLHLTAEDVILYPRPTLYSGDTVTFDVVPRQLGPIDPEQLTVRIYHQRPDGGDVIAEATAGAHTFGGPPRARIAWVWDTAGLEGQQFLTVWLDPEDQIQAGDEDPTNNRVTLSIDLRPPAERPEREIDVNWDTFVSDCCVFYYLSGTAAERDLAAIVTMSNQGIDRIEERLGSEAEDPLNVYLIGKVIGHGGYMRSSIALSYLDRRYGGYDLATILRHEATHALDAQLMGEPPPALLREGLAVWAAGGHFRPDEPIPQRTAALLRLEYYAPLDQLADNFYTHQHESGYLEAAGFVAYLVETHGWEAFVDFYGSFDRSYDTPSQMLDAALEANFDAGLETTEREFIRWLGAHPPTPEQVRDLEITIRLFDTLRHYQRIYDPGAYFVDGWFPDPAEAEKRGIVADFLRHPHTAENVALETMLIAAQDALAAEEFSRSESIMEAVNAVLNRGTFDNPMARDYLSIVEAIEAAGYEVQRIELSGDAARVEAIAEWPTLMELQLRRSATGWGLLNP